MSPSLTPSYWAEAALSAGMLGVSAAVAASMIESEVNLSKREESWRE